jgi:predicted CopG family antitoxin
MATFTDTTSFTARSAPRDGWFTRTTDWLDARGRGAWIAAMVAGFIAFWPVGLGILAYMIWSKRMFSSSDNRGCGRKMQRNFAMGRPSGNAAFDAYKADTLRRLQEEQDSFESFLERLREAKDKSEFDTFMDERTRRKDEPSEA